MPSFELFSSNGRRYRERARQEIERQIKEAKKKAEEKERRTTEETLIAAAIATDFMTAARMFDLISDKELEEYRKKLNDATLAVKNETQKRETAEKQSEESSQNEKENELNRSMSAWKNVIEQKRAEKQAENEQENGDKSDRNLSGSHNAQSHTSHSQDEEDMEHTHGGA